MSPTVSTSEVVVSEVASLSLSEVRGKKGEYIYRSKLPDIEIHNNQNLASYCFEKIADHLDRPALIDGASGKQYTFREMELLSRKIAAGLDKQGISKGDVIALLLPNCPEFPLVFLGSCVRGSVVTTANPFYTPGELAKQLIACKAKLIVTFAAYVDKVRDLGCKVVTVDSPPEGCLPISVLMEADEKDCPQVEVDPDDVVALPYSSGTTGLPKGVMLTHKSLISSVAQQVDGENPNLNFQSEDVMVCLLPMFHIYSLNSVLLCSFRVCCSLVIMTKYEISALLGLIQKYKVTVLPIVPPIVLGIAKSPLVGDYDVSSVKMVLCGAAPLGKELEDSFIEKLPGAVVGQGYGMTEAGPVLSMCLAFAKNPFPVKPGSCGTVVRNAEVKIVDPDTGVSLPHGQPGEMCIRGPQIMKGYLNDPLATANTIDEGGWLHTGDIAFIDDNEEVFIVDRVKEIIKFKGFQVPPAELEGLLVSHPLIREAAVVPKPNEAAGEVPVAFVVKVSKDADLTEDEVKAFIAKQVVFYKKLHSVIFVDSIPTSPSGKILRKILRAQSGANLPKYLFWWPGGGHLRKGR
ncbi:hypothetical protein R1flu_011391 [Riccia fluitans]|uniref:4-coumarate--CoA ligase n=1 Tax=Riccia fluitans TaxID=41844 RepID=A0ABD1ZA80_9MARC